MSIRVRVLLLAATALGASSVARAQDPSPTHRHDEPEMVVPRSVSARPIGLLKGVGGVSDPVTTSSKDAQAYYNQGVSFQHLFVYLQAARSFNEAIRRDSNLAMAYLGLSRAYSQLSDTAGAREAREKAKALAPKASRREQLRIAAATGSHERAAPSHGHSHGTDASAAPFDQRKALDQALAEFPDDPELWIQRGQMAETQNQKDMTDVAYFEAAISRAPNHPAPHHYLVHTYERINRIDLAVKHGEILARLAPNVAHAQHMYGHDLRRVGRVDDAIRQFERADALERKLYATDSIAPRYDWHHPHNLHLLSLAYRYQGRVKDAERLLREKASLPPMHPSGELYNRESLIEYLLSQGRLDEVRAIAANLATKGSPMIGAAYLYRGHLYLAEGKIREADAALKVAADSGAGGHSAELLRGELMLRAGLIEEGSKVLKGIITEMRADYGPDGWINTLFHLESIARTARDAGAWGLADHAAQQMVAHDSAYGGSHLAVALVAEQRGDVKGAQQAYARAKQLWIQADADLPALRIVEQKIASVANAVTSPGTQQAGDTAALFSVPAELDTTATVSSCREVINLAYAKGSDRAKKAELTKRAVRDAGRRFWREATSRCVARFNTARLPASEVFDLANLADDAGDTTLAHALVSRRLTELESRGTSTTPSEWLEAYGHLAGTSAALRDAKLPAMLDFVTRVIRTDTSSDRRRSAVITVWLYAANYASDNAPQRAVNLLSDFRNGLGGFRLDSAEAHWLRKLEGQLALIGQPLPASPVDEWLTGADRPPLVSAAKGSGGSPLFRTTPGVVTVIELSNTSCGACAMYYPTLQDLHERYEGRGVQVVIVSFALARDSDVRDTLTIAQEIAYQRTFWPKQYQLTVPIAFYANNGVGIMDVDGGNLRWGTVPIGGFPTFIVVDGQGIVRYFGNGGSPERLTAVVESLAGARYGSR